jgi:CRISPR-associated protein Cas2
MFVILVYDINEERVAKALKICRKYLHWVQKSVFEGEITPAKLEKLKAELKQKVLKGEEDSVVIYILRTTAYTKREIIGGKKGGRKIIY